MENKIIVIDKCVRLSVADLKRLAFFSEKVVSWVIRWGDSVANARVDNVRKLLTLSYVYNDEHMSYNVPIVERRSNLGRGVVRFFLCPTTNTLCRKLYLVDGRFVSRRAIHGAMYRNQTKSRRWRNIADGWMRDDFIPYRRYGKPLYRGKLTPYGKRIQRYEKMGWRSFEEWCVWLKIRF